MQWEETHHPPPLFGDETHVWRAVLDLSSDPIDDALVLLSADERRRAGRFRFAVHRDRFIASRAFLRKLLGAYLDIPPASISLSYSITGRPRLASPAPGGEPAIEFNLSHSGDWTLLAVARGRAVGIDLERMRRGIPHQRIAARFFTRSEAASLRDVPAAVRPGAFFTCWTRKEAYLKATGSGLGRGLPHALKGFAVTVAPGEPPAFRHTARPNWSLVDLDVAAGYVGAVAVEGRVHLRLFEWIA